MRWNDFLTVAAVISVLAGRAWGDQPATRADVDSVAGAISAAASGPDEGEGGAGHPLPLAGHWNVGAAPHGGGFGPDWQMQMIRQGRHLLPWFDMPEPGVERMKDSYYEQAVRKAAKLKLPISFVGTQWEHLLTDDPAYFNLAADRNPNVIGPDGKPRKMVCPFGPAEPWAEVGRKWTATAMLKRIQEWYPDPPRVLFISNNEHVRLTWKQAEQSKRYLDLYGRGRDDEFKRKVVGEGWIARYRALQAGMRQGLAAEGWKKNSLFVGYEAFGPSHLGRWDGWPEYSLCVTGRIDPWPLAWDGGSPSYYVHSWCEITDYTVWSPQVESMNWMLMQEEARRLNPNFWWEISIWDGHDPLDPKDKRKQFAARGQTYSPQRYLGFVQFGLWLLRPRLAREFRGWTDTLAHSGEYFEQICAAVDRVHGDAKLAAFWRKARLVANPAGSHPYQRLIPEEYKAKDRWFLLDTSLSPRPPLKLDTQIPVFAMALVLGEPPRRQWLVYAHAPLGERKDVEIALPAFGAVKAEVPVAGTFLLADEAAKSVTPVR